jgi:hypothetical protein
MSAMGVAVGATQATFMKTDEFMPPRIRWPNMEQAMDSLPTANAETTQYFRQWLETFAG